MPGPTTDTAKILRRLDTITRELAGPEGKYLERSTLLIARTKRFDAIVKESVANGGSISAGERAAKDETFFYWEELQTLEAEILCLQEERDQLRIRLTHSP